MAVWIAKAIVQKVISFLPAKHQVNHFFQKNVTKGLELTDQLFESKLNHCGEHFSAYKNVNPESVQFSTLELGTGWFPVVPIGLFLCNASNIYSIDIESLLTVEKTKQTIQKFIEYHESGKLHKKLPMYNDSQMETLYKVMQSSDDLKDLLAMMHFEIIVGDILDVELLKNEKIDLIHSNNTFEHIPVEILLGILLRFKKMISNRGVMSHFIDMSDHFSHFDKKISAYNFLRFSDRFWKLIDNGIQPQNRLRISDYKNIYKQVGLIIKDERLTHGNRADLTRIALAKRFQNIDESDLVVTHALLVS